MKEFKYLIWRLFKKLNLEILPDEKKNSVQSYLKYLIDTRQIDCIFDVGANQGQFYKMLRSIGYKNQIKLFEPLPTCWPELEKITRKDNRSKLYRFGVGNEEKFLTFYETKNSVSSSFKKPLNEITIKRLHNIPIKQLGKHFDNLAYNNFLKIDAQGFEREVVEGTKDILKFFCFILMELSVFPQYQSEPNYIEMLNFMDEIGYQPIFFYPGVANSENEIIQLEVIFRQKIMIKE